MKAAERLNEVGFSPIRVILEEVRERKTRGEDICSFCAGEPDFNTPEPVKEAVCEKLMQNRTHYSSNRGVLELRQEIAKRMSKDCGVTYDAETEILLTTGGAEAIQHAMMAFVNPGDEVIIFTPAFVNYAAAARLCGACVVELPLSFENGYQLDIGALRENITDKTRMIVINNPCNPTGAVYRREELVELCELARRHNILILSDEIYGRLTYGEHTFYSIGEFPQMKERVIIVNGFSKAYAMTGWRVGYLMASKEHIDAMVKVHQYTTTSGNTFVQEGLAQSMNLPQTLAQVEEMRRCFEERGNILLRGLEKIPGIRYTRPQGAFYLLLDISESGLSGETWAKRLLEEEDMAVVPAAGFGEHCEHLVRMSFATSEEVIEEGLRRLEHFMKAGRELCSNL